MKKILNFLKIRNEGMAVFIGILTSIITFSERLKGVEKIIGLNSEQFIALVNFLLMLFGLWYVRTKVMSADREEFQILSKSFSNEELENSLEHYRDRVNKLGKQLVFGFRGFAICLLFFYGLQFIFSMYYPQILDFYDIRPALEEYCSLEGLLNEPNNGIVIKKLFVELIVNGINIASAIFLFIIFNVLHVRTISDDNQLENYKSLLPVSVAVIIMVLYSIFLFIGIGASLFQMSNLFRFFGGAFNAFAMILLFGKLLTFEPFYSSSTLPMEKTFYQIATKFFFPLLVITQLLYGWFNNTDKEMNDIFQQIVFLFAFWGKLAFILFMYTILKHRWFHCHFFIDEAFLKKSDIIAKKLDKEVNNPEHYI